jgi:hypothetical protein
MVFCLSSIVSFGQTPKAYENTRKLLSEMKGQIINSDKLVNLFQVGDKRIVELVKLLDDTDAEISLRSQIVLRYLGNEEGTKELFEWYNKQKQFPVKGPIPLPLREWDFKVICAQYINEPRKSWVRTEPYIYALALDDAAKSATVLKELIKSAGDLDDQSVVSHAIRSVQSNRFVKSFSAGKNISKIVLSNAFFVSSEDKKYASARLLGQNYAKDKVLVEVLINRGYLSEEYYHVVIKKEGDNWRFFSITQVAVS